MNKTQRLNTETQQTDTTHARAPRFTGILVKDTRQQADPRVCCMPRSKDTCAVEYEPMAAATTEAAA